jgi:hypothetical protein
MKKQIIFITFFAITSLSCFAQNEQTKLTIIFNDSTSAREFIIPIWGNVHFTSNYGETDIIIVDDLTTEYKGFKISKIQKILIENYVSINENELENIKIFPNPSQDFLQINNLENENIRLEIFSINGVSIMKDEFIGEKQINISKFLAGTYLLKINNIFYQFTKV